MDPTELRSTRTGAWVGACFGLVGAAEMLAENARTINPAGATLVLGLWLATAAGLGAVCGWVAARGFRRVGLFPEGRAAFFSAFVVGHLFAPPLVGPGAGVLFLVVGGLRRRLLPRHRRLDSAIPLMTALVVGTVLLGLPRTLPPPDPAPVAPGTPLPGSIPVTLSVHGAAAFPRVPAVHVRLRELAAGEAGARAALWSGRAPARTRAGREAPRKLAGGGLSRFPPRPAVRPLTAILPRADETDPAFRTVGTLPEIVAAAGIPVLRVPPAPDDPPLYLRILDRPAPPPTETARRLREAGAWIDVTLAAPPEGEIALAGEGIAMTPVEERATLMDVAPTALHLLGLAIPRDCDGRVLLELLKTEGPGARAPRYRNLGPPAG